MIALLISTTLFAQECPRSKIKRIAVVEDFVQETSGMVITDDLIWVHNDSGDSPTLYAINFDGVPVGRTQIKEAFARDWEEMTTFYKDGERYFLIGDVGDNRERKTFTEFYVIKEPTTMGSVPLEYSFTAEYDIGPKDAEALFVDPRSNDLIVLTKGRDGTAYWLRAPLPSEKKHVKMAVFHTEKLADTPPSSRTEKARFKTASDISKDGSWIITRNYLSAKMWYHPAPQDLATTLNQPSCRIPLPLQEQGETIAFSPDGTKLWTLSEGSRPILYQIELQFEK